MATLLAIEMLNTIIWLVGVCFAGAANGFGPWKRLDAKKADSMCFPIAIVNYFL